MNKLKKKKKQLRSMAWLSTAYVIRLWVILIIIISFKTRSISSDKTILEFGDIQKVGDILWDSKYKLVLNRNCLLVLFNNAETNKNIIWTSFANLWVDNGECFVVLESNGNLKVYNKKRVIWDSKTGKDIPGQSYRLILKEAKIIIENNNGETIWEAASPL